MQLIAKSIKITFLLLVTYSSYGQIMPHIGWFQEAQLLYNPAYAGTSEEIRASFIGRRQWREIEGAPKTETFTIDKHIGKSVGAGLDFSRDEFGSTSTFNFSLNGSYRVYLNSTSYIQGGIKAGISNFNSDYSDLEQWDGGDPLKNNITTLVPKIGFGFMFIHDDVFLGVSIPNFIAYDTKGVLASDSENRYLRKNYIFTAGTKFEVTEYISFVPSAMLRYYNSGTGVNFTLNAGLELNQTILVGASYIHPTMYGFYGKISVTPRLKLGYRHEVGTEAANLGSLGTGELLVTYGF